MSPILDLIGSAKAYGWGNFSLPGAFESIATATASGGETSLVLSSIPQTYKHLQIRATYKDTYTVSAGRMEYQIRFNGSSTGYSQHFLIGDGTNKTSVASIGNAQIRIPASGISSNSSNSSRVGVSIVDIIDYASTTKNKVTRAFAGVESDINSTEYRVAYGSGIWVNTAAVNSITFLIDSTAFAVGTSFALYGIKGE